MGVYVYTMRSQVIEAGGQQIGVYKYAYKPWRGWDQPARFARAISLQHAAADRARAKNKGLSLFVVGDPKHCTTGEGLPVYEMQNPRSAIYDDVMLDRTHVGSLCKQGRRWIYKPLQKN